jgi:TetR/AcrR family transcriptional repressor of mexCD-oprJ operon
VTEDHGLVSVGTRRVRTAIVEAAAVVLNRDETASMQDVADAAGVGRATLYRHFPSRETLLAAMWGAAVHEAGDSLGRANLDRVTAEEAIARATRALLANAEHYAVVSRARMSIQPETAQRLFVDPLTALLQRGQEEGVLRADLPPDYLYHCWIGMVLRFGPLVETLGVEDASDAIVRTFLDGARARR